MPRLGLLIAETAAGLAQRLVTNSRTARDLGVTMPDSVLLRSDRVVA